MISIITEKAPIAALASAIQLQKTVGLDTLFKERGKDKDTHNPAANKLIADLTCEVMTCLEARHSLQHITLTTIYDNLFRVALGGCSDVLVSDDILPLSDGSVRCEGLGILLPKTLWDKHKRPQHLTSNYNLVVSVCGEDNIELTFLSKRDVPYTLV